MRRYKESRPRVQPPFVWIIGATAAPRHPDRSEAEWRDLLFAAGAGMKRSRRCASRSLSRAKSRGSAPVGMTEETSRRRRLPDTAHILPKRTPSRSKAPGLVCVGSGQATVWLAQNPFSPMVMIEKGEAGWSLGAHRPPREELLGRE